MRVSPDWSPNFKKFVNEWKRKFTNGEFLEDEYLADNPFHIPATHRSRTAASLRVQFLEWYHKLVFALSRIGLDNAELWARRR